jgi:hypothetical protein
MKKSAEKIKKNPKSGGKTRLFYHEDDQEGGPQVVEAPSKSEN